MDANLIQLIAVSMLPMLLGITLHEAAHGYVALRCGDNTAKMMGRVTLNPIRHVDLVGTIIVPLMILFTSMSIGAGGMLFGWAKPVPVNFGRLNNPKRDMRYVAFAGPASNLMMAVLWAFSLKVLLSLQITEPFFIEMAKAGITINLVLAALNLLPILPLDGGRILFSFLPNALAYRFGKLEPYGMVILIGLLILKVLPLLIYPLVQLGGSFLLLIFNL